jgi:hypothetical protein
MNIAPTREPSAVPDPVEVLIKEARQHGRRHMAIGVVAFTLAAGIASIAFIALGGDHGTGAPRNGTAPRTGAATGRQVATTAVRICASRAPASLSLNASIAFPVSRFRIGSFTARLVLCQKSVVSGYPLTAVLAIDNHTNRTLATYQCPDNWIYSGVVKGGLSSVPAVATVTDLCRSNGPPYVPPGTSYMTVELPTVSSSCDRGATVTQQGTLPCTRKGGWPPALPLGRYETSVQIGGLPLRSDTLPLRQVRLVSCTGRENCACSPVGDRPVNGRWVPFC